MANDGHDNAMASGASNDEPSREGLRAGTSGASNAAGPERDPDQGADMSDTGGAQWDSVFQAGGMRNEPGLEGLQQDAPNTGS
jgi:hypothetical protein